MTFILSLLVSINVTLLMIMTQKYHGTITLDHQHGKQKFHSTDTLRVGGIAIFAGIVSGILINLKMVDSLTQTTGLLLLSLTPIFLSGLVEDITKVVRPKVRLILAFSSGIFFFLFMDISVKTDIAWLDAWLANTPLLALMLTALVFAGVSNATNIIDGFNGLLLGFALMATAAISLLSFMVNDALVLSLSLALLGATLGLFLFNFPLGKIFTGDGGAYLIGFMLTALSLMLTHRNAAISPWFPLLLLLYPITETLFSMSRRILVEGISPFEADDKHLHTQIFFLLRKSHRFSHVSNHNALTSVFIWAMMVLSIIPALILWQDTTSLMITVAIYIAGYIAVYNKISQVNQEQAYGLSLDSQ